MSLTWFQGNINSINKGEPARDSLVRMVVWFYMNEMVRDGKIKIESYRNLVLERLADEPEDYIYNFELGLLN